MIACAHCGTAMPTPTGQASRKRYCGVHCRKAAWRERHRHDPAVPAVPSAFPDDVPTPGGHHHCPNCRQPLAIISVVIPADAAIVNPPEVLPQATQTANLKPPPGEDDVATLGNFGERQQRSPAAMTQVPSAGNAGRFDGFLSGQLVACQSRGRHPR